MNAILTRIEYVKRQPHEAKKRIAMSLALLGTTLIALVWLTASLATGAFALGNGAPEEVAPAADPQSLELAGAAGALPEADAPAHIEIVDTAPEAKAAPERTIIPF